jgi:hypothetical protein
VRGLGRVAAAAPEVATALGYDIDAALEEPDGYWQLPSWPPCAGQLHGHWKEAGMVTRDQPRDDGWTVVLRRQPARIMNGRPQGPAARRSGGRTGSVSSPA